MEGRIDVHQHYIPPAWADALPSVGGDPSGWKSPTWSPESAIAFMDEMRIAKGILSLTAPSVVPWPDAERRTMARQVNEYGADLARRSNRFGFFATLPLPDLDGALAEAAYALDTLMADGIVLLTNYRGMYLGDERLEPLWAELARRRAIVFVHPTSPPVANLPGIPGPVIDYPFDTTRAAVQLAHRGVLERHPELRIILSHAGGFLPYASQRFAELLPGVGGPSTERLLAQLRSFYFDTALSSSAAALPSLLAFAKPGHVLFGSDFPYAPASVGKSFAQQLDAQGAYPDINYANADALFTKDSSRRTP